MSNKINRRDASINSVSFDDNEDYTNLTLTNEYEISHYDISTPAMEQRNTIRKLTSKERNKLSRSEKIEFMREIGMSPKEICKVLKIGKSTYYREMSKQK